MSTAHRTAKEIDRIKLKTLIKSEEDLFAKNHPRSKSLFDKARKCLLGGVPMNWMIKWAGPFPVFVKEARGVHFTDVDGLEYLDFCLGDTGAMTGHAPDKAVDAICDRIKNGTTFMLPTEDAIWVGEELALRFGLPYWQMALTATDANRFSIRLARQLTGRKKILVFNWCYHGTVDETFITLDHGKTGPRSGNMGPPVDPSETTRLLQFDDLVGLERALADRDVACVLAEPVMTNIGIVHPEPGFHDALRKLTRETGTLLILDETHTICTGPGGYTRAHGLKPDIVTLGKPIASGIPAAVYGISADLAEKFRDATSIADCDTSGIGGTLAGNALSLAAMRVTLERVLTEKFYERTIPLAERFTDGVESVIAEFALPWVVKSLGCRVEYWFRQAPPVNGAEAAAAVDADLDRYMHLAALNRGILMTPFHNMALISESTSEADIDRHTDVFRESVRALVS